MFQPELINKEAAMGFARAIGSKVHTRANSGRTAANRANTEFFSADKVKEGVKQQRRNDGNGIIADPLIWTAGAVTPKRWNVKEKILGPIDTLKDKMEEVSTNAAGRIVQNRKPDGMAQRFFSVPETTVVGKKALPDGTFEDLATVGRRTSLTAPIENTMKVGGPLLGSMYVAEKLYPMEDEQERQAFEQDFLEEKNGLETELLAERLDKKAALDKVAHLETKIEKLAYEIEGLEKEKDLFWKQASSEAEAKRSALKEKEDLEKQLLEKKAEHEELKLRTIAKERSGHAVKIAEAMLEDGLIKQAEFDEKVDFLMDCDSRTFNLHSSLLKQAETHEKGLESSAFFIDYRDKDEESSPHRSGRGLSKKGQTIGEAAKDLNK